MSVLYICLAFVDYYFIYLGVNTLLGTNIEFWVFFGFFVVLSYIYPFNVFMSIATPFIAIIGQLTMKLPISILGLSEEMSGFIWGISLCLNIISCLLILFCINSYIVMCGVLKEENVDKTVSKITDFFKGIFSSMANFFKNIIYTFFIIGIIHMIIIGARETSKYNSRKYIHKETYNNIKVKDVGYTEEKENNTSEVKHIENINKEINKIAPISTGEPIQTYSGQHVENIEDYYIKLDNPDLSYLNIPEIFEGDIRVAGPNSVYVNNKFIFLYGIYSNPKYHDINEAVKYLQDLTQNRKAYCFVIAYSQKTKSATGLCFVNGVLLNKSLVLYGVANNIALK